MATAEDFRYMAEALRLAAKGLFTTDPNPRVGCLLVHEGRVVGAGYHLRAGLPHAEIEALRQAGRLSEGATCYVTLEPCSHYGRTPPCAEALIEARVGRVVVAVEDPNPQVSGRGIARLKEAGIPVEVGVLAEEARRLNRGFFKRMERGLPFLFSKIAASLDGKTALADGESRWITSEAARRDVHRLRARSSAVMTGIGTVLRDNPRLTVRLEGTEVQPPVKVVVDSRLKIPPSAKLFEEGEVWIATTTRLPEKERALFALGAQILHLPPTRDGRVDLRELMRELARREINEVMVEAGATLNGALLEADLVDEWVIYMAPTVLGEGARGMFDLKAPLTDMAACFSFRWEELRQVGRELRITVRGEPTRLSGNGDGKVLDRKENRPNVPPSPKGGSPCRARAEEGADGHAVGRAGAVGDGSVTQRR